MTWKQLTERDCSEWKLSAFNPYDRNMWRSAMHAASQLSGGGPLMWMLPLYLHVNQKFDYDDMIFVICFTPGKLLQVSLRRYRLNGCDRYLELPVKVQKLDIKR